MKTLVILPTYNEVDNIDQVLSKLCYQDLDILVIDDNSYDGTLEKLCRWTKTKDNIFLIKRERKLGLGTAYITGFKWGLKRNYKYFFEMDADLSHDPSKIPEFIEKIKEGYDLVIGSRYLKGINIVGWDIKRLLLSKFANWYALTILNIKNLTDITSGYRVYTRECLESIDLNRVKSNGYAFQIEMAYKVIKKGLKVGEIPIIFYERNGGSSKMNKYIILEAAFMVWKLKFSEFRSCHK